MQILSQIPRCALPLVALTFDDGPTERLSAVLDLLSQHDARATFFWNGTPSAAEQRRVTAYGHEIGSHGRRHLHPYDYQDIELRNDMRWSWDALGHPRLYRPPYGEDPMRVARLASQVGMDTTVMWSVDTKDYKADSGEHERVMKDVKPGAIILGHEHLAEAWLPTVLPALKKSGFRLVTVSQMLLLSQQNPPTKD